MFRDEAFGGEQVGGAEGADTVFAGLPGDDAGEQFQHVAFEVLGLAFGGAIEEALGALAEGAGEQALQAGFRAHLERAVEEAQAAFAKQFLRDVEDELAHGPGEAEQVRLVGAVDDHLPRLQRAVRARHRQPARGGCFDHAAPYHRQHQRPARMIAEKAAEMILGAQRNGQRWEHNAATQPALPP